MSARRSVLQSQHTQLEEALDEARQAAVELVLVGLKAISAPTESAIEHPRLARRAR